MKATSFGQMVAEAWDAGIREEQRRLERHIDTLHDWRRARNGQYVDTAWRRRGYAGYESMFQSHQNGEP